MKLYESSRKGSRLFIPHTTFHKKTAAQNEVAQTNIAVHAIFSVRKYVFLAAIQGAAHKSLSI